MSDERLIDDERLDEILATVLEREPPDNGFTERVVARIRPSMNGRRAAWRRFVTRPMALAAAAVFLMSVAYAAIRTTSLENPTASEPARPLPGDERGPSGSKERKSEKARPKAQSSPSPAVKAGTAEYGYTSPHTAYAIDQGLRLEAETYVNEVDVNQPRKVTLSLENLTDQRTVVHAPRGCLLSVSVSKGGQKTATTPGDSSGDGMYFCANSEGRPEPYPGKSETEYVVLEPHSKRVEHATIAIPEPGEWAIVGHCNCFNRTQDPSPTPTAKPSPNPLLPIVLPFARPGTTRYEWSGSRFFTPPIRMLAE